MSWPFGVEVMLERVANVRSDRWRYSELQARREESVGIGFELGDVLLEGCEGGVIESEFGADVIVDGHGFTNALGRPQTIILPRHGGVVGAIKVRRVVGEVFEAEILVGHGEE